MKINIEALAVLICIAPGAVAYFPDYMSIFLDEQSSRIGKYLYDINATACFNLTGVHMVEFYERDRDLSLPGPFCLHAFLHVKCEEWIASVEFKNITGRSIHRYSKEYSPANETSPYLPLPKNISAAHSFRWTQGTCVEPAATETYKDEEGKQGGTIPGY